MVFPKSILLLIYQLTLFNESFAIKINVSFEHPVELFNTDVVKLGSRVDWAMDKKIVLEEEQPVKRSVIINWICVSFELIPLGLVV